VPTDLQADTRDIDDEAAAPRHSVTSGRRFLTAVLVTVNLPIVVATVRALARGWQPIGDNGILLVRARDVGTSNHPLLGSWTSASLVLDQHVNNPGPLYFDAVAPWLRLLGPWVGLAVGVMVMNVAASSGAVLAARRIAGATSMAAVAVVVVGVQFAMGSELLFDMWQPNALVLPFLAYLVVVTGLAGGDLWMAPWALGLGSLVVQTHMSHAVLVAVMTLAGLGLCVWALRRRGEPVAWRRPVSWTAAVVVLAWAQPVIEQFTSRGDGNLSRIAGAATAGEADPIGWSRATKLVAEIGVMGPWFTRRSYGSALPPTASNAPIQGIVGLGTALVVLALLGVAIGLGVLWAVRTGRQAAATVAGVAGIALAAGYVALATSPVNLVAVAIHQMRWLWPIAALVTAAAITLVLSSLDSRPRLQGRAVVGCVVLAAAIALANLPTYTSESPGPTDQGEDDLAVGQELMSQLGALEGRGTVLYDPSTLLFAEPYSGMTFAEMQDRGIPFVFDDEGFIRQFGEGRRHDGSADLRLWQVEGAAALTVPPGAEQVAFAERSSGPVALLVEPLG
jgi:hypothetical protein